jgi:hypothetical protein
VKIKPRHPPCPYCHGPVGPDDIKAACDSCMAWHHRECWEGHGSCAACAFGDPPLVAPRLEIASGEVEAVQEELRLGNAHAAQVLCLDLRSGDERAARRLYRVALADARERGWIDSARRQNAKVIEALVAGRVEEAQALCFDLADEDEERAKELYEFLLARAREQNLVRGT